jgi:hypothetical protein
VTTTATTSVALYFFVSVAVFESDVEVVAS